MQGTPSVSIVLPVWIKDDSSRINTLKCITLLRANTKIPFELVIVETASKHFIGLADIYVYEKTRTNPNVSVNRGFRCCNSDYVVFVGNDVFVGDGWLESLIDGFNIPDCGIATLGNNEHGDTKQDKIIESIYFSICMVRKEDAWFDPEYKFVFDDTDMIFRIYTSGRKCYKNLHTIVQHNAHSTLGEFGGDRTEYERSRAYFKEKWKSYHTNTLYKTFVG